jgi:hypothetical protein
MRLSVVAWIGQIGRIGLIVSISGMVGAGFAAGAQPPRPSALAGVAGLARRVTYTETKVPLGELVEKVAGETGVKLTAGRSVADEPVAVVVKEMPARELLDQLAGLLDYQWSRQGHEGAWRYEIDQDLAAKQREEALRQAQMVAVEKRLRERLASYVDLARMPEEKLQALLDTAQKHQEESQKLSPELRQALLRSPEERAREQQFADARALWTPANRALARLVGSLTPRQWNALRKEGWLNFCTDPQPGEERLPVEVEKAFQARQPGALPSLRPVSAADSTMVEEMRRGDEAAREQWASASGYRVTIRMDADRIQTGGALWLTANAAPLRSGEPMAANPLEGDSWRRIFLYAGPEDLPQQQEQAAEQTPERLARLQQDPVVGVKKPFSLTVKPRRKPFGSGTFPLRFRDLLPDLARIYGVQLLSDAYWTSSPRADELPAAGEPTALFTLLDRLAGSTHRWQQASVARGEEGASGASDRVIRLRSRTWFFDRPREVPLRMVRHWQQVAAVQGILPLEEYVAMASSLTDAQLDSLDQVLDQVEMPFGAVDTLSSLALRHALRLYASLSPGQRQALAQGRPVPVAEMTPLQRTRFLIGLKEDVRRWAQPIPVDASRWTEGSFALARERLVRTILNEGGSVYLERVDAPHPGGSLAAEFGQPVAAAPARVDQVKFQFRYGPGETREIGLTVALVPASVTGG